MIILMYVIAFGLLAIYGLSKIERFLFNIFASKEKKQKRFEEEAPLKEFEEFRDNYKPYSEILVRMTHVHGCDSYNVVLFDGLSELTPFNDYVEELEACGFKKKLNEGYYYLENISAAQVHYWHGYANYRGFRFFWCCSKSLEMKVK